MKTQPTISVRLVPAAAPPEQAGTMESSTIEKHYTPNEIAKKLSLDPKVIRNLFRNEPGVVKIGNDRSTYKKRAHTTLRIPHSVYDRVHQRMQVKG